jgi:hypothetical protein
MWAGSQQALAALNAAAELKVYLREKAIDFARFHREIAFISEDTVVLFKAGEVPAEVIVP